jgi:hypothetical protein
MTRLFIENYELDIQQDFSQQITYSVDDLNNLDSKSTSFTKTIVLPATANNNRLLGNIFEFSNSNFTDDSQSNVLYNFNASKSAKARIEVNGLPVIKGVIRLLEIFIDGNNVEYEVALFGELGGFVSKVGAKKITDNDNGNDDLDFSNYDHTYTIANILTTWDSVVTYNITSTTTFTSSTKKIRISGVILNFEIGATFSITGTTSNNNTFTITNIFIQPINFGGIRYTELTIAETLVNETDSNFTINYNKVLGKGYIYPLIDYGNCSYDIQSVSTSKKDYQFKALRPAFFVKELMTKIITDAGYTYSSDFFNTNFFKRLIVPNNYKALARKDVVNYVSGATNTNQIITPNVGNVNAKNVLFNSPTLAANISYNATTGAFQYTGTSPITIKVTIILTYTFTRTNGSGFIYFNANAGSICNIQANVGTYNATSTGVITLNSNDNFSLVYKINYNPFSGAATLQINSGSSILIENEGQENIPYQLGDTIRMNDLLPKNVLQKDFFTSILKMFNLMVSEDKLIDRHLIIEPNVSFYNLSRSSYLDWSDKVDRSQVIKIKPMSEVSARYYTFKYKDDTDYYNDKYKKQYNETYGTRTFDNQLEFAKDTESTEVIFAPTPLVGYANRDKIVSTIFKLNNNVEDSVESVIRILQVKVIDGVESYKILNNTTTLSTQTRYCYAGHFDDPDVPNADLNFGIPKELYFALVSGALSNNLFNTYYSSYMAEITDKDSRLVTCKMKFTEKDIYNLDFGRFIWFDGVLYRLIKIIDYADNNICEVQLLRVIYTTYELPNPESDKFNFRFFGNQISSGDITFEYTTSNDFKIYWGDGTSDTYNTSSISLPTHTYATSNNYIIEIELLTPPAFLYLYVVNMNVTLIKNIKQFTNIADRTLSFNNGFLTSSDVNSVLNQAVAENWNGSSFIIDLSGNTPPAPPTGQGVTDKATLIANSSAGQIITD